MFGKRLSLVLLSFVLTLSLVVWLVSTALLQTIGQPAQAKQLMARSGIYQAVITSQLASALKNNPSVQKLPLDNPSVQKYLKSVINAQVLQQQGDQAIDAVYTWLEGNSSQPQINITIVPDASSLADAAGKYAAGLPVCQPGQSPGADVASNPLSATCRPPEITPDAVRAFVATQLAANPGLVNIPPLTQNDIKIVGNQPIAQTLSAAPGLYHWTTLAPRLSLIAAVFCMVMIGVMLGIERAARFIGRELLIIGVLAAAGSMLIAWGMRQLFDSVLPHDAPQGIGHALTKLTELFTTALKDNILHLGLYMAGTGLILVIGAIVYRRFVRSSAKLTPTTKDHATAPKQVLGVGTPERGDSQGNTQEAGNPQLSDSERGRKSS